MTIIFPEDYNVIKKIGEGGTAEVFLARHKNISKPIAVKCFFDDINDQPIETEKTISRKIHFPGIVKCFDMGVASNGRKFVTLEYCEGQLLEKLAGKLSEEKFLAVLSATAAALYVLHSAGYCHNDLKPSNTFCPTDFDDDDFALTQLFYVKLSDFSLASDYRISGSPKTSGTVGYMSPEMISGQKLTPRSDLFSFGVMAHYLASSSLPFRSDKNDPLEVNAQITEGERPELSGLGIDFSQYTKDLITSLLEINPENRPSSAFELLEELARAGSVYPFRKAVRPRHLIAGMDALDENSLPELFGKNSFSTEQLIFIEKSLLYDPAGIRIILEHNFDNGRFARLDGSWGWQNPSVECIEWPERLSRFALRPLYDSSLSLKKFALALAVVGIEEKVRDIAEIICSNSKIALSTWRKIPQPRRRMLLASLNRKLSSKTRRIVSKRIESTFDNSDSYAGLRGNLLLQAENYKQAINSLMRAIDKTVISQEKSLEYLDLAFKAAQNLNDFSRQAKLMYRRAGIEKEAGLLETAEKSFLRVVELSQCDENDSLAAQSYKILGDLYKDRSDYSSGIRVLNQARILYERLDDTLGLSQTLNNLGNMYWVAGKMDKALEQYVQALGLQRQLKSQREIASTLTNIGSIYVVRGEYDNGVKHLSEALEIKKDLGDKGEIARTWNNLGVTYFMMGKASGAISAFQKSLKLNIEIGVKVEQLLNYENLAEVCLLAGRLNDVLGYLKEGNAIVDILNDEGHKVTLSRLTGQMLRRMGVYSEAEFQIRNALTSAMQLGHNASILPCYLELSKLYIDLNDFTRAGEYLEKARDLACDLDDKQALFFINIHCFIISGEQKYILAAEQLQSELKTQRELSVIGLVQLEKTIESREKADIEKIVNGAKAFFSAIKEDIDLPRFHLDMAMCEFNEKKHDAAQASLNKALKIAKHNGMLPEQWQASCLLSEIAFELKDFEDSFVHSQNALDGLKKISKNIVDTGKLQKYYTDKRIIKLLGRLKSLKSVLSNKKGAAIGSP
ncbi:MAG: serine/threonine-protein kinase [candidate division Zixibacteria bacterium]